MEVYIELFLLDNFLMGCIVLLAAEPFARCRLNRPAAVGVSAAAAVYAVFAVNEPVLLSLPFKALLLAVMALPFLPRTWQCALRCGGCVLIGTFIMGGASYMITEHIGASGTRVLMITAAGCAFLLRPIKRLLAKARLMPRDVTIFLRIEGNERKVLGRIDTGNTLREPLTGLPVVVLHGEATADACYCVPFCTIGGGGTMPGVKGKIRLAEDTEGLGERDCCVAFSPTPLAECDAVVNAELFAV